MRWAVAALGFLGLIGCAQEAKITTPPQTETFCRSIPPNINAQKLNYDVQRWTSDGHLDCDERREILERCGYKFNFALGPWGLRKTSISYNDKSTGLMSIYNFSPDQLDMGRFLAHYQNR